MVGAVAEPHSVDVACDDEGELLVAVVRGTTLPLDGSVEGVGEAVFEQAVEIWVLDERRHVFDGCLDNVRLEGAALFRRSLVGQGVDTTGVWEVAFPRVL